MNLDRGLESGHAGQRSTKGSVLCRLAAVMSRALRSPRNHSDTKSPVASGPEREDPDMWNYKEPEDEEACAKIWSIYVGEAEQYDAALVESWKADMEGMLIFSGLFSASLTAFLIESYQNLQSDSGDLTVAAINRISHQLAAIASNTSFVLQPQPSFTPTAALLWCNAL
ncbi:hypothetical protein K438DRAFT_583022 [Mycena galopus ATCC 62051]|nr:hypothetical protein K438DRAFT_583022 [Mycena galopus ATCC 62051]